MALSSWALRCRALACRALLLWDRGFSRTDVPGTRALLWARSCWALLLRAPLFWSGPLLWCRPPRGPQQRLLVQAARLPDLLVRPGRAAAPPRVRRCGAQRPEAGYAGVGWCGLGRGRAGLRAVFRAWPYAPRRGPEGGVLRGGPHGAPPLGLVPGASALGASALGASVLRVRRCFFGSLFTRADLGRACVRYDGARRMIRARAVAPLFVRRGR
jgi:hypothetical protein